MAARTIGSGLTGTLQGFLWASAIAAAVCAGYAAAARAAVHDDRPPTRQLMRLHDAVRVTSGFTSVLWIVVFVLLLVWMWALHEAASRVSREAPKWPRGWTIGGWFVPLANLVIPRRVFAEIERRLRISRTVAGLGRVWWLAWCSAVVCFIVAAGDVPDTHVSDQLLRRFYGLRTVGMTSWAVSCIVAAVYVGKTTRLANSALVVTSPAGSSRV